MLEIAFLIALAAAVIWYALDDRDRDMHYYPGRYQMTVSSLKYETVKNPKGEPRLIADDRLCTWGNEQFIDPLTKKVHTAYVATTPMGDTIHERPKREIR